MLYSHGPARWRDGLEAARRRPSDAEAPFRPGAPQPRRGDLWCVRQERLCPLFAHAPVPAADAPSKDIHAFIGTFTINTPPSVSSDEVPMVQVPTVEPLSAENVLWANTVLAAGSAIGFVVYTGPETRAVMNTSHPQTKVGLLDLEISQLAKVCHPRSCQAQHVLMYERRFYAPCHSRCPSRWLH